MELYLTPFQIKKLKETNEVKITSNSFRCKPNTRIEITKNDLKQINAVKNGKLEFHIHKSISGGFLPIVPVLAGVAAATTIGKNIYDAFQNKKINTKLLEQKQKQNSILEMHSSKGLPISLNQITSKDYANAITGGSLNASKKSRRSKLEIINDKFNNLSIKDQKKFLNNFQNVFQGKAISLNSKRVTNV